MPVWAQGLGLQPHPEGGWFVETYRSDLTVEAEQGERNLATAITFLLLPGEESAWHVVSSDEIWIHQRGGPLVLTLGGSSPAGPSEEIDLLLGTDGTPGQAPQRLVPAGVWQAARPATDEAVLVACVVAPGFDYRDWRLVG